MKYFQGWLLMAKTVDFRK